MNPNDPNVVLLEEVAERLGADLRERLVFIGGAVAGLMITDPAMPAIRATEDVDLVTQVAALQDFYAVERQLLSRGFVHDMSADAPICRWRVGEVAVDVMPTDEAILGFSNRWYSSAVETAQRVALPGGVEIRLIYPPLFVATKLEAFAGRGNNDFLFSHDLGDLIAVVDGRESLVAECQSSDVQLRIYLRDRFAALLKNAAFRQALPGHLPPDKASQARAANVEDKLHALANLDNT